MSYIPMIVYGVHKVKEIGVLNVCKRLLKGRKGTIPLYKLKIDSENAKYGVQYHPSPDDVVISAIESLPINYSDYTFIDIGSGKGVVLKLALKYGFKKVVGVEFARELVECAKKDVPDAESICSDATLYDFPSGPLCIYMYNPFERPVLEKVMEHIGKLTGEIYIIYLQCQDRDVVKKYAEPITDEKWMTVYKAIAP